MAKLEMRKIEIIALLRDSQRVVERLQRRGVVELSDLRDDRLVKINTDSIIAQFERNLLLAASALEAVNSHSGRKRGMLAALNGRKSVSTADFAKQKEKANETLRLCMRVTDDVKKIGENENAAARFMTQVDTLAPWSELPVAQNYRGTSLVPAFIGTLPGCLTEADICSIVQRFDEKLAVHAEVVHSRKELTYFIAFAHKSQSEAVLAVLRDSGFIAMQFKGEKTPLQEIESLESSIEQLFKENDSLREGIAKQAEHCMEIEFLIDFLQMRIDKYRALNRLAMTGSTVIISGFIPLKYVQKLSAEFEQKYTAAITVSEPEKDENVPVLLQNGRFASPVEGITEMYALPAKGDVDPSGIMAFFYYLFFGMMLSDAGYGLLMLIGTTIALRRFTVEGKLRKSLRMFQYCGISTLGWGILFGSWFGDLPQVIASTFFNIEIATTALWFEPLNDPITLLLFSFALGICHLFLGLGVRFYMRWKEGKRFDALCDVIPVYLTVLGVAPVAASILAPVPEILITVGTYLAAAGVVLIILTAGRAGKNIFSRFFGGLYGLYNTATGYLSDILSYSRLLALGLATGSIASVINLICSLFGSPAVTAAMLLTVGVLGHVANMGINLLGAYVHADRLQFVELFSKFYEGGGRAFEPLKVNTKYIKFERENIYE